MPNFLARIFKPPAPPDNASDDTPPTPPMKRAEIGHTTGVAAVVKAVYVKKSFQAGFEERTRQLIKQEMKRNVGAINSAIRNGSTEKVLTLLANPRVDPNGMDKSGMTPFCAAAASGRADMVEVLLAHPRIDQNVPNKRGEMPMHIAVNSGHLDVLKTLLAHGQADPNERTGERRNTLGARDYTPLHLAARVGDPELVRALLADERVQADPEDFHGHRPLYMAAQLGRLEVVKILLENDKVDPNALEYLHGTPLHVATAFGHFGVVKTLLDNPRIDPNAENKNGESPLATMTKLGRLEAAKVFLGHPRVDPNAALPFLLQKKGGKFLQQMDETYPQLGLAGLPAMEQKAIRLLEHWADFRPFNVEDPESAQRNKKLTAGTNFLLGLLHAEAEKTRPLQEGSCGTGAVFRLTLALEQTMQAEAYAEIPSIAEKLLATAPEASHAHFLLDGVDVPRAEIQALAEGKGSIEQVLAMENVLDRIRNDDWEANVHIQGFLLRGQDLLEEIQRRNEQVEQTKTVIFTGMTMPMLSEAMEKKLNKLPLSAAIKTTLCPEYQLVFDQAQFKPAMFDFLDSETNEGLAALEQKLLNELQKLPLAQRQSLNPRISQERLQQRMTVEEVRRVLLNIKTELRLDPLIIAAIRRETRKIDPASLEAPIRAHLAEHPDEDATTLAQKGLRNIWVQSEPIDEEGLRTDTHNALDALWRYITNHSDKDVKQQLTDMLMLRLIDIGQNPVCNTGCVQRIVMDTATVDTTLEAKEPADDVIADEIHRKALAIHGEFDENFMNVEEAYEQNDPELYKAGKNLREEVVALKRDLISEATMQDLVKRRGWSQAKVEKVLDPILKSVEHL